MIYSMVKIGKVNIRINTRRARKTLFDHVIAEIGLKSYMEFKVEDIYSQKMPNHYLPDYSCKKMGRKKLIQTSKTQVKK